MDKNIIYIILICVFLSILIKTKYENYSSDNNFKNKIQQTNAICFITRTLDPRLLNFAEKCSKYNDTYIIVDDNNQVIDKSNSSNVKILQINNDECMNNNYTYSTWRFNIPVTGWDKAFYYFCEHNIYDNVWFIEDDVFIPSPDTLYNIDNKYDNYDLLSKSMINIKIGDKDAAWEQKVIETTKLIDNKPLYWSMVCAVRCSKNVLKLIQSLKNSKKRFSFHEMTIPSLVKNNLLTYKLIPELKNIEYRKEYEDSDILENRLFLYHPIKDYDRHELIRSLLNKD